MAVPTYIEAANALHDSSPQVRIAALRHLKSAIIGYVDKKDELVRHGILDALASLLQDCSRAKGKRKHHNLNGHSDASSRQAHRSEEEEIQLQCLILIASFAHEGPAAVPPILASNVFPHLLDSLSPLHNHRAIVTAALKALTSLTAALLRSVVPFDPSISTPPLESLASAACIESLALILAQQERLPSDARSIATQTRLVAKLIRITVTKDDQRDALVNGGVLDLLSGRLASTFIHRYSSDAWDIATVAALSPHLAPLADHTLPHVLAAINSIVTGSKYRILRLVASPLSRNIFTLNPPDHLHDHATIADHAEQQYLPRFGGRPMKYLVTAHPKDFPTLAVSQAKIREQLHATLDANLLEESTKFGGYMSSLSTWLLATIKETRGMTRCQAALLATHLYESGLFSNREERLYSQMVVPSLLDTLSETRKGMNHEEEAEIRTMPLAVLAKLTRLHGPFHRAAIDAGAIKMVCQIFRGTFEPVPLEPGPWTPHRETDHEMSESSSRSMGSFGLFFNLHWLFLRREYALLLIAVIAASEDKQRQAFLDGNIVPLLIEAMKPLDETVLRSIEGADPSHERKKVTTNAIGNPVPVLVAACFAVKSLSRSVALLRTSLADAGLPLPALRLLSEADIHLRKAATDIVVNLSPEFSPSRKDICDIKWIKLLCQQAHSADPDLRLASLWVLMHLVYSTPNDVKQQCFDELGAGWLVQIITGNTTTPIQCSELMLQADRDDSTEHVGRKAVDTLDDFGSRAISMLSFANADLLSIPETTPQMLKVLKDTKAKEVHDKQLVILDTELHIQRQGLDFIRNMIMGQGSEPMIDHVLENIGDRELFDIVSKKIYAHGGSLVNPAPGSTVPAYGLRTPRSGTGTPSGSQLTSPILTSPKMLNSAVLTLTHIAAGSPRHRQLVMSQSSPILTPLLQLLSSPDPQIRLAVANCIANLTWRQDDNDAEGAKMRAIELQRHGFVPKLEQLCKDPSVDVKERIVVAHTQLVSLLEAAGMYEASPAYRAGTRTRA